MSRKKSQKKRKHKTVGIEAVVAPGVGALYVRGTWMKRLNEMGKRKRKQIKKSYVKRKY
jgi:hypothetical protein